MNRINRYKDFSFESNYAGEWPLNKQEIGVDAGDVSSNPDFASRENKFQEVQEYMKIILKPILLKKNSNADERDVEKVSDSFFRLGNNKSQEIKKMVDGCVDAQKCAQDIIDNYLKYVKINFGTKDNINDVEQDSVMSSENILYDDFYYMNEGKAEDVEIYSNFVKYHQEVFPGFNNPKKYIGKGKYKYRVLAREGNIVKPINFGTNTKVVKSMNRLDREYWNAHPYFK